MSGDPVLILTGLLLGMVLTAFWVGFIPFVNWMIDLHEKRNKK